MNPSDPRHDWMRQYAEGTASAEVTAQLEQALREDAAFRLLFLEYLSVDLGLSNRAACWEPAPEATVVPLRRGPWRAFVPWAAAAAALLQVGVSAWARAGAMSRARAALRSLCRCSGWSFRSWP